jgi:hypothetical protein
MKKMILLVLALTLAGCSAYQPVPPTPQPTPVPPTAQVIIATVLVPVAETVIVTQALPPTVAPTQIPPTTAPTDAVLPTATATASNGPFALDDNLGAGFFKNMSYSANAFSLRCLTKSVTFNVTAANTYIVGVEFYYRIQDKNSIDISGWIDGGLMVSDKHGNFSLVFSAESIDPDWRRAQTWFDFQFVGLNKSNEAVGRSEKIVKLINYSNDCP